MMNRLLKLFAIVVVTVLVSSMIVVHAEGTGLYFASDGTEWADEFNGDKEDGYTWCILDVSIENQSSNSYVFSDILKASLGWQDKFLTDGLIVFGRERIDPFMRVQGKIGFKMPNMIPELADEMTISVELADESWTWTAKAKQYLSIDEIQIGDVITFGHYEQDADESNGAEPIEWIVLDYDADKQEALLISKYGLDSKQYHHERPYPTWEKSDLRSWMNSDFLNAAFSIEEQERLKSATISTDPFEGTDGGADTQDKVWLLSIDEFEQYVENTDESIAEATAYAISNGAYTENGANCYWWLRSPGLGGAFASDINNIGFLVGGSVIVSNVSVRPTVILNLAPVSINKESWGWTADQDDVSGIQSGDIITYGHYEQDADESNGAEPIEWIVLDYDVEKQEALLVSKYALSAMAFHHEKRYPAWENSDLRAWLNSDFLNAAFTEEERKGIHKVKNQNA